MDNIILIAQQLSLQGKTPTTALLKAHLPKDVSLPMIIQGLKMWRENPHKDIDISTKTSIAKEANNENSPSFDTLLDDQINQALNPLIAQINELKIEIADLRHQLIPKELMK